MAALGQAFIDVHANTTQFGPEVRAQLKAILDKVLVKVKVDPDTRGFRTKVQSEVKALGAIKFKIEPEGLAAFRKAIRDESKASAAKVSILPTGIPAFRKAVTEATADAPTKIHILPTGINAFRKAITEATLSNPAKVAILPTGIPAFRAAIKAATDSTPVRVAVTPVVGPAATRGAAAAAAATSGIGQAAQKAALTMEQAFGRGAKFVEDELRQMATSGDLSIKSIKDVSERAARAIIVSMGNAAKVTEAEYRKMAADIAASIRGAAALGNRDFDSLAAAAAAAAARIRESFASASASVATDTSAAAAKATAAFEAAGGRIKGALSSIVSGFGDIIKKVVQADAVIGAFGVKGALDLEQLRAALLGVVEGNDLAFKGTKEQVASSTREVERQVEALRELNKLAPAFSFKGLVNATKNLQVIGISGDEAIATVKVLANALAAAGSASDASLSGAVLPLLQAASTGKLLGQDLNQLAQRIQGVFNRGEFRKISKELFEQEKGVKITQKAYEDLRAKGLIPAAIDITAVITQLKKSKVASNETGTALERQAKTVQGKFNTIRRTIENSILDLFEPVKTELGKALDSITPQINKAFGPDSKFLLTIQQFVLKAVPIISGLIDPIIRFATAVNEVLLAAFEKIGPKLGPFLDGLVTKFVELFANVQPLLKPLGDIITALGIIGEVSLEAISIALGQIGIYVGPIASVFKGLAETLYAIATSGVGHELLVAAGAIAAIALATTVATTLTGIAAGIVAINVATVGVAGTGGAAAGLLLLKKRFAPFLITGAIIAGLDVIAKKLEDITGVTGGFLGTVKSGFENIKLFGGDIFDATLNSAQGAANGITAAFNTIPGVDIDTTEFNQKMDAATAKVIGLHETLGGIPKEVKTTVVVDVRTVKDYAGRTSLDRLKLLRQGIDPDTVDLNGVAQAPSRIEKDPLDTLLESLKRTLGGVTGGDDEAKGAADKAKAAAETFRDRIRAILESLDASFRETLTTGAQKAVDNALESLVKSIRTAFKGKKTTKDDVLIAFIQEGNKRLDKLIKERDGITNRFGEHVDGVLGNLEKAVARAKAVSDATINFANITNLEFKKAIENTIKLNTVTLDAAGSFIVISRTLEKTAADATKTVVHSGQEFADALKKRLAAIKSFRADIEVLIARGLNKATIDQILAAGVEGGSATADALANASKKVIDSVNKTQKEIDKQATDLGSRAADSLFRAGKSAADGLIEGLKERRADIADAIGGIATELIKRIRKDLKIQSPSRVMRDLFRFAGSGAVLGINDSVSHVGKAATALAKAALPRFETVSAPDLQSAAAAQSMAELKAQGASNRGGVTPEHIDRVVAAVAGARPAKEIHAPITQHFSSPVTPSSAKMAFGTVARR